MESTGPRPARDCPDGPGSVVVAQPGQADERGVRAQRRRHRADPVGGARQRRDELALGEQVGGGRGRAPASRPAPHAGRRPSSAGAPGDAAGRRAGPRSWRVRRLPRSVTTRRRRAPPTPAASLPVELRSAASRSLSASTSASCGPRWRATTVSGRAPTAGRDVGLHVIAGREQQRQQHHRTVRRGQRVGQPRRDDVEEAQRHRDRGPDGGDRGDEPGRGGAALGRGGSVRHDHQRRCARRRWCDRHGDPRRDLNPRPTRRDRAAR